MDWVSSRFPASSPRTRDSFLREGSSVPKRNLPGFLAPNGSVSQKGEQKTWLWSPWVFLGVTPIQKSGSLQSRNHCHSAAEIRVRIAEPAWLWDFLRYEWEKRLRTVEVGIIFSSISLLPHGLFTCASSAGRLLCLVKSVASIILYNVMQTYINEYKFDRMILQRANISLYQKCLHRKWWYYRGRLLLLWYCAM